MIDEESYKVDVEDMMLGYVSCTAPSGPLYPDSYRDPPQRGDFKVYNKL